MLTSDLYSGEQPAPRVETVMDSRPQRPAEAKPSINDLWPIIDRLLTTISKNELKQKIDEYLLK